LRAIAETYIDAEKQNLDEAILLLETAVKLDPKNEDGHLLLGDALLEKTPQNGSPAIKSYNKVLEINPKSPRGIVRVAKLYQRAQNFEEANKYYQQAKDIDATYAPAYRENAELNMIFKQSAKAIENWKKSAKIAKASNNPYIEVTNYNNIGGTLIDMNQFEEAEKYLQKSIDLSEKNGKWSLRNKLLSYRLMATLYDRTNRQKQAGPIYEKVNKAAYELMDTNLICSNLVFHAAYLEKQGNLNSAIEKTTEALHLIEPYGDKNSLMTTLLFHSKMLSKAGRYKEAYEFYVKAFILFQENYKEENQLQINQLETQFKTKELAESKKLSDAKSLAEKRQK
jgi:tetratricopeptide (TPR) repeat protein